MDIYKTEKMTSLGEYFTTIRQASVLKLIGFFSGDQMLSPLAWGSIADFEICKKGCRPELWFRL